MEPAFVISHFAGKVKYQIKVSREMDKPQATRQSLIPLNSKDLVVNLCVDGVIYSIFDITRISGRRTPTTCVLTSWRCCGAVTVPTSGSSSAWTRLPCSAGASCAPPSEASLVSMRPAVPGLPKHPVRYQCTTVSQSCVKLKLNYFCYWQQTHSIWKYLKTSIIEELISLCNIDFVYQFYFLVFKKFHIIAVSSDHYCIS